MDTGTVYIVAPAINDRAVWTNWSELYRNHIANGWAGVVTAVVATDSINGTCSARYANGDIVESLTDELRFF